MKSLEIHIDREDIDILYHGGVVHGWDGSDAVEVSVTIHENSENRRMTIMEKKDETKCRKSPEYNVSTPSSRRTAGWFRAAITARGTKPAAD